MERAKLVCHGSLARGSGRNSTLSEKMTPPILALAWFAPNALHERLIDIGQRFESGVDIADVIETVHPIGSLTQFARCLRTSEHQYSKKGNLSGVQWQHFGEHMVVLPGSGSLWS